MVAVPVVTLVLVSAVPVLVASVAGDPTPLISTMRILLAEVSEVTVTVCAPLDVTGASTIWHLDWAPATFVPVTATVYVSPLVSL